MTTIDKQTVDLLKILHRGGNYHFFQTFDLDGGRLSQWLDVDRDFDLIIPADKHLYFGVNSTVGFLPDERDRQQYVAPKGESICAINCLFADFDGKDFVPVTDQEIEDYLPVCRKNNPKMHEKTIRHTAVKELQRRGYVLDMAKYNQLAFDAVLKSPVKPSVIWMSGGGYQAFWLLDNSYLLNGVCDVALATHLQSSWVNLIGADKVMDLRRILRLPGSYNAKPIYGSTHPQVEYVRYDLDVTYPLETFINLLGKPEEKPPTDNKVSKGKGLNTDYNRTFPIAELLLDFGYTEAYSNRMNPPGINDASVQINEDNTAKNHNTGDPLYVDGHKTRPVDVILKLKFNGDKEAADKYFQAELQRVKVRRNNFVSKSSAVAPVNKKRNIDQLKSDLFSKANEIYDLKFITDCADKLELGDSDLIIALFKGQVAYDHADSYYYFWNNLYWECDLGENIPKIASEIATQIYKRASIESYAIELEDKDADKKSKIINKRVQELSRHKGAENALKFARATMGIGISGKEWDKDCHLLGVSNGVINLQTGKIEQSSSGQFIRTISPVIYDPTATCPRWEKSLSEIFDGDLGKVGYVQRLLGYALSGECTEADFPIWYGKDGQNGKEYILERVRNVLGDKLAGAVEPDLLLKTKATRGANGSTEALMALRGRRIAWASETNEGQSMDLARMKDLSGGHVLTGRHNHGKQTEWKRTHTLLLLTNHLPHVNSQSLAEWNRIKVLTFPLTFVSPDKLDKTNPALRVKDSTLGRYIDQHELPGVLNWLIAGCLEWRKKGLQPPTSVSADTDKYQNAEDTLGLFISESCVVDSGKKCKPVELFLKYKAWADNPMGKQTFYKKIEERGFKRTTSNASEYFIGIAPNDRVLAV